MEPVDEDAPSLPAEVPEERVGLGVDESLRAAGRDAADPEPELGPVTRRIGDGRFSCALDSRDPDQISYSVIRSIIKARHYRSIIKSINH